MEHITLRPWLGVTQLSHQPGSLSGGLTMVTPPVTPSLSRASGNAIGKMKEELTKDHSALEAAAASVAALTQKVDAMSVKVEDTARKAEAGTASEAQQAALDEMNKSMASLKAQVASHSEKPVRELITGRTRLIRRSAFVKVPSFSKNEVPGKNT